MHTTSPHSAQHKTTSNLHINCKAVAVGRLTIHECWVIPRRFSFATTNNLFGSAEINRMNRMSRSLRSPPPVCILKQSAEFQISAKHTQKADSHKYLNYTQLYYMCAPCFKTKLSINNHFLFLIHMAGRKSNNSD